MAQPKRERVGELVITPRPLADYRDMFLLTDDDLTAGPILDCPGGTSPFGAQVRRRGGTVVSVDPSYDVPRAELAERSAADLKTLMAWAAANPDNFDWSYLGGPGVVDRYWQTAAELFFTDFEPDGERYVPALLPSLPFTDGQFRLALSSHLLFSYPEYLSFDDHLAGILELVRVTAHEVRIFPLVDTAGAPHPRFDDLLAALAEHGVSTEIRPARASYVAGGDQLLVCWRGGS
ncbi:hypothetical protein [Nocardioides speluncae]|uniref:hypothetical protein n=1 Tax=Nocardioides speluncae TaxID=2670337 RepID=UPI000D689431|nr:hypothetical protein [Nocardioides speluncae]